jgi:hypothetical protein
VGDPVRHDAGIEEVVTAPTLREAVDAALAILNRRAAAETSD